MIKIRSEYGGEIFTVEPSDVMYIKNKSGLFYSEIFLRAVEAPEDDALEQEKPLGRYLRVQGNFSIIQKKLNGVALEFIELKSSEEAVSLLVNFNHVQSVKGKSSEQLQEITFKESYVGRESKGGMAIQVKPSESLDALNIQ